MQSPDLNRTFFSENLSVDMFLSFVNTFSVCLSVRPADIQAPGGLVCVQHSQDSPNTVVLTGPSHGTQNKQSLSM